MRCRGCEGEESLAMASLADAAVLEGKLAGVSLIRASAAGVRLSHRFHI